MDLAKHEYFLFSKFVFIYRSLKFGKLTKHHDLTNKWRNKLLTGRTSF